MAIKYGEKYEAIGMFPKPLFMSRITEVEMEDLEKEIRSLEWLKTQTGSVVTEDKYVLEEKQFESLRKEIEEEILPAFVGEFCGLDLKMRITQSWFESLPQGGAIGQRRHPNSVFTGIVFLSEDPAPITFADEILGGWDLTSQIMTDNLNWANTPEYEYTPRQGTIILFPSRVWNFMRTNETENDKSILTFNTFFASDIGSELLKNEVKF